MTQVAIVGGVAAGYVWPSNGVGDANDGPVMRRVRITPTAAAHTYKVRGYYSGTTSGIVKAGDGTVGNFYPAYILVTKA